MLDKVKMGAWAIPGLMATPAFVFNQDTFNKFIAALAVTYKCEEKKIVSSSRKRELVYIRQLLMYYLRTEPKKQPSFKSIGTFFNNRDHSSVMHGASTFTNLLETDALLPTKLNSIHSNTKEDYNNTRQILNQSL